MHIHRIEPDEATGPLREVYDAELAKRGYVPNYARAFSLRPDVYVAWRGLVSAISGHMDVRRYELVTLAAAEALRCRYCVAAHADVLESRFYGREQLEAMVRDFRNAGLDPVDVAIMAFAEKVALHAYRVTPEDVAELRGHGLQDAEILDVALAAAARSFFSKTLDAVGAGPDEQLASTTALFELVYSPT